MGGSTPVVRQKRCSSSSVTGPATSRHQAGPSRTLTEEHDPPGVPCSQRLGMGKRQQIWHEGEWHDHPTRQCCSLGPEPSAGAAGAGAARPQHAAAGVLLLGSKPRIGSLAIENSKIQKGERGATHGRICRRRSGPAYNDKAWARGSSAAEGCHGRAGLPSNNAVQALPFGTTGTAPEPDDDQQTGWQAAARSAHKVGRQHCVRLGAQARCAGRQAEMWLGEPPGVP